MKTLSGTPFISASTPSHPMKTHVASNLPETTESHSVSMGSTTSSYLPLPPSLCVDGQTGGGTSSASSTRHHGQHSTADV